MKDLLIGIDVGTTLCKAAVVTLDGEEVAHGRRPTPWTPVPTGAEVDPNALAEACVGATLDALDVGPDGVVRGIGVCSMGETGVMVDKRGEPLAPAIAWHDRRGDPEAERLGHDLGQDFSRRTGLPIGPTWTATKYRAHVRQRPALAHGRRWLSVAEWIVRWLGGDEVAELSLASRTGFLDVSEVVWWPEAVEWAGMSSDVLPPLVAAGTRAGGVTRIEQLKGAALAVGGHDHPCAAVGAGALGLTDALDSCGTAEAILRFAEAPMAAEAIVEATSRGITVGRHVVPDHLVLLGFFKAGMALRRILQLLGVGDVGLEREALDRAAVDAETGSLVVEDIAEDFHRIVGIAGGASPGALWRAAQEASAHEMARILTEMAEVASPHERLVVAGGWSRSEAYRTIKAGVLGGFNVPRVTEAGARGAALFGGLAAGLFDGIEGLPGPRMGRS